MRPAGPASSVASTRIPGSRRAAQWVSSPGARTTNRTNRTNRKERNDRLAQRRSNLHARPTERLMEMVGATAIDLTAFVRSRILNLFVRFVRYLAAKPMSAIQTSPGLGFILRVATGCRSNQRLNPGFSPESQVNQVNRFGHHFDPAFQSIAARCASASIKACVPLRPYPWASTAR
jgi:hypothetical protein